MSRILATTYFPRSNQVSSALMSLTSLFGMGRGGTPSLSSPWTKLLTYEKTDFFMRLTSSLKLICDIIKNGKAHDLLVQLS